MVQSLINPDVHYPETQDMDPEDAGFDATVCELQFPNSDDRFFLVALGKMKYTFHDRGMLYYPVYLLSNETSQCRRNSPIKGKIGVVEVPVKNALRILDENKQIRLEMLEDPLLFAFATDDYLDRFSTSEIPHAVKRSDNTHRKEDKQSKKKNNKKDEDEEEEEEEEKTLHSDEDHVDDDSSASIQRARQLVAPGIFKTNDRIVVPAPVPEETETEAKTMEEAFDAGDQKTNHFWVQRFMKNDRYGFHAVHGNDADSLLACVCDAFQQIGEETTVAKLRAVLALEATASVFKERREAYEHLMKTMEDKRGHMKKVKEAILDSKLDDESRRKLELKKKASADELILDERLVNEMVGTEFRDITTLAHFREFIMTNRFFPDAWAVGVLEKKLNIHLIVLSEDEFEDGDVHHVVKCNKNKENRPSKPDHYIILAQGKKGGHVIVSYKNAENVGKKIFAFAELPWTMKQHMAQRCAELRGQGFGDAFSDLASQRGYDDDNADDNNNNHKQNVDDIVFQFYRNATTRAAPGKGPNEHVPLDQLHAFQPLRRIRAWRQKLDDSWPQGKFELDGKSWASVTHYTQSRKFRKKNPDYADTFALESRTAISKNVDLALNATAAASSSNQSVKSKPSQIDVDAEYTAQDATVDRVNALHAKFTQNADLQSLLKATHPATLNHYVPRKIPKPDDELMALRQTLLLHHTASSSLHTS